MTVRDAEGAESSASGSGSAKDVVFTVTLSEAVIYAVTVDYEITPLGEPLVHDGHGHSHSRSYDESGGSITFAAGDTSRQITVAVTDNDRGGDEKFRIDLTPDDDRLNPKSAVGTVRDTTPTFYVIEASGRESGDGSDSTVDVTVALLWRSKAPNAVFTVDYATEDMEAVAGEDYVAKSGTLTFDDHSIQETVRITIKDEDVEDAGERFKLTLSNPSSGAQVRQEWWWRFVTIRNDEGGSSVTSTLSAADASAAEDGTLEFAVTLDPAADDTVTVDYATSDGSATAGEDYEAASGTLTFNAGDTTKTVSVSITDDADDEENEELTLTLSNAAGATIEDATASGTIEDDDETAGTATLTAAFHGMPATHDGSSTFDFEVEFSEEVKAGFRKMRDDAFTVVNADITQANRVNGRQDRWQSARAAGRRRRRGESVTAAEGDQHHDDIKNRGGAAARALQRGAAACARTSRRCEAPADRGPDQRSRTARPSNVGRAGRDDVDLVRPAPRARALAERVRKTVPHGGRGRRSDDGRLGGRGRRQREHHLPRRRHGRRCRKEPESQHAAISAPEEEKSGKGRPAGYQVTRP